MNSRKLSAYVFVLGVLFAACGGDGGDPVAPEDSDLAGGKLTKGGSGANTVVTLANSDSAFQELNEVLFNVFHKASNELIKVNAVDQLRMLGDHTGYAIIDGTADFTVSSFTKQRRMAFNFDATFYDYSDVGRTYIGGVINYSGHSRITATDDVIPQWLIAEGEIKFAGPFGGSVEYHYFLIITEVDDGSLLSIFLPDSILARYQNQGYLNFTSGGNTFFLQPYPDLVN
jgi:hypothetical protein